MFGEPPKTGIAEIQSALHDLINEHNRNFENWRQSVLREQSNTENTQDSQAQPRNNVGHSKSD